MQRIKAILLYFIIIFMVLFVSSFVKAAEIYIPEGQNFIMIQGTITKGDSKILDNLMSELDYTNNLQPAHILLESGGGSLVEGVKMSVLIKLSGLSIIVTSDCASACSVVFSSGNHKLIIGEGRIGLHTPYSPVYDDEGNLTDIIEEKEKSSSWWLMYGSFISNLQDAEIAKRWIDFTYMTPSKDMFWITKDNASLFGITHIE